jgi:putative phosphoesterase
MKLAIISDIHGNLVALEAVLADIERERVDQIICLGDIAYGGPQPRQVLALLRELAIPIVQGNTDAFFINEPKPDPNSESDEGILRVIAWARTEFSAGDLEFFKTFEPRMDFALDGGKNLLCFHGSPRSNTERILATTPDAELAAILGNYRAAVMTGGHTHIQMFRRLESSIIINPGSVGMPFERDAQGKDHRPGFSEYALVTSVGEDLRVELRRVRLDVDAVIAAISVSALPEAEKLIAQWNSRYHY